MSKESDSTVTIQKPDLSVPEPFEFPPFLFPEIKCLEHSVSGIQTTLFRRA
jgi:hypothetical protein